MGWENINFTKPALFSNGLSAATSALAGKASDLNAIAGQLTGTPSVDVHNAAASFAVPFLGNADLHQYTTVNYRCFFVHPWCEGIGQGVGHYRYLAPANAVSAAAKKFSDSNDSLKPSKNMDVLLLLIAGASPADLHTKLAAFLAVFSHPDIYLCASRCKALASLEQTKEILPDAALNARWKNSNVMASGSMRNYVSALGDALSFADGYSCDDESAEDEIANVAQKKANRITAALAAATAETNKLIGSVGKKYFISNKAPATITRLLNDSGVGYEAPISVCLVLSGEVGSLENVRGLFNAPE